MAHAACDYCGNALSECECSEMVEFEICLEMSDGTERHYDVRTVPKDDGNRVVIAHVEELGGTLLNPQQKSELARLWQDHTGEDLYDCISRISTNLI